MPMGVKAQDKVVSFLDKILEDNELKIEIPHMFNYTSNGNYQPSSSDSLLNDSNYITK